MLEVLTLGAVLGGIGNCLLDAVGGKVFEGLEKFGGRQIMRYTSHWSLPENEHVARALRTAQFSALSSLIDDFESWTQRSPQSALGQTDAAFLAKARRFAAEGRNAARKLPDAAAKETAAKFEATLDKVLAGKTATDERARVLVIAAEQTVLDELRKAAGLSGIKDTPQRFIDAFRGRYDMIEGWHARFVHYWQDAIKHNEEFRSIFTAERLARIAEGIEELKEGQARILDSMGGMEARLLAAIAAEKGVEAKFLAPLFDAVGRDMKTIEPAQFETAIRVAVDALLAKAADKAQPMNDPLAVAEAINAARACLMRLDVAGAVGVLDRAIEEQDSLRQSAVHGEVRLLTEKADILSKAYRWNDALETLKRAAELDPNEAWHWFRSGDIHVHQGRLDAALADFGKGRDSAGRSGNDRDLSVSHLKIGDVRRAQGDLSAALAAYEAGLTIREKLASGDPSNSQWQRDLSVSHERIGDIRCAQGDLAGALSAYEAGLAIAGKLASGDPSNSQWQRDLSVSHERIGDVRLVQGDLGGALAAFEAGLAIAGKLASSDPSNSQWQRDLSVSHERIGDIRRAQGDLAGALSAYEAGLAIRERLASGDPSNSQWQRDLSVSHERIGDIRRAQGVLAGALSAYEAGLAIRERLASGDPSNSQWQRDLSVSHDRIGDIRGAQCDLAGALSAYEAGLAIAGKLASGDPSNSEWQRDLSVSHERIGDIRLAQGDLGGALAAYEAGLAIAERLASGDPSNSAWQRDLSVSLHKIGDVRVAQGDLGSALAAYEAGLVIREKLASGDPSNSLWQRDLIVSHVKLSQFGDEPVRHLEQALAIANRLKAEGRLAPVDAFIPGMLEERLKAARGG